MRGRKPTPTAVRVATGNPQHRPINGAEPQFGTLTRMPSPPDYLTEEGRRVWRQLGRQLRDAGLLTKADLPAFGMLCSALGMWMEEERRVVESGTILVSQKTGGLYQNPALHVANKRWEMARKMLAEFGLTPAERSRVRVAEAGEEDDLAALLFGRVET